MRYIHYAGKYMTIDDLVYREQDDSFLKPHGLWYSPITDKHYSEWYFWVLDNGVGCNTHPHEVILKNKPNIVIISNLSELNDFIKKYGNFNKIKWSKVVNDYDGIQINNYNDIKSAIGYKSFNKYIWFYTWDISSGCIWDPKIINEFFPLKTIKRQKN